ncbi:ribosomal RNA small subunit methyltransferase G [Bacteroidia bacterium]|nr:ribosomal RNA small subunit methyltransferase G [Bacteroidia bacterium]
MIEKYFPNISQRQKEQLSKLPEMYKDWNEKINVISRQDIENIEERHILHSLAIAKIVEFKPNTNVLDIGTGGGFPGIPLAIMFPNIQFHLVDSIEKKIKIVKDIAQKLELKNVHAEVSRVEALNKKYDFIVNRAVKPLPLLLQWIGKNISNKSFNDIPNGVICLKGGDLSEEIKNLEKRSRIIPISNYFEENFFETKKILYYN